MFYETGKRKIQEDRKILAHSIPAGERERAHVCRVVCSGDAGLCVVGNAGLLNLSLTMSHGCNSQTAQGSASHQTFGQNSVKRRLFSLEKVPFNMVRRTLYAQHPKIRVLFFECDTVKLETV
jgi:hypothetical protein